jgi:hypothetical protein
LERCKKSKVVLFVKRNLLGSFLHVSNDISTILGLLETSKGHLGTRDIFLGVLKIVKEGLVIPGDTLLNVGRGV